MSVPFFSVQPSCDLCLFTIDLRMACPTGHGSVHPPRVEAATPTGIDAQVSGLLKTAVGPRLDDGGTGCPEPRPPVFRRQCDAIPQRLHFRGRFAGDCTEHRGIFGQSAGMVERTNPANGPYCDLHSGYCSVDRGLAKAYNPSSCSRARHAGSPNGLRFVRPALPPAPSERKWWSSTAHQPRPVILPASSRAGTAAASRANLNLTINLS